MHIDSEAEQIVQKAEDLINSIHKSDIIELKENRQNEIIVKTVQILCLIKGKAPTWQNARDLLNPLTFKLEFSMTDVGKLRSENIARTVEWLTMYKDILNNPDSQNINQALPKIIEWTNCILSLFKYNYGKKTMENSQTDSFTLPKVRPTAMAEMPESLKLTGTKKEMKSGAQQTLLKSEIRKNQAETNYYYKSNPNAMNSKVTVSKRPVVETKKKQKQLKGRYIPGKIFGLGTDHFSSRPQQMPEIPMAVLRGVGKQKAIILKAMNDEKSNNMGQDNAQVKNSERLGQLLDKFVDPKET